MIGTFQKAYINLDAYVHQLVDILVLYGQGVALDFVLRQGLALVV